MTEHLYAIRGRVVGRDRVEGDGVVVVAEGKIAWSGSYSDGKTSEYAQIIKAAPVPNGERYILPGLVDVHCHGGGGTSFPDATTYDEVMTAVLEHRAHGTTSLVASCVTAAPEVLCERAELLTKVCEDGQLAGIHFEGPFLDSGCCGAQDPAFIQNPDPELARELLAITRGYTATMTIAPEKPEAVGEGSVTEVLIEGGALPSYGHCDADAEQTREAVKFAQKTLAQTENARSRRATVTHLFNGMRPMHHRAPGPIPEFLSQAAAGGIIVELIGDGTHLHPDMVRSVFDLVGRESIVLITDAMAAAGLGDGKYRLGPAEVVVKNGVARLAHGDSIAGGTAHLLDVVRTTCKGGVPLVDAVFSASVMGAEILGRTDIGQISVGKRADLILTDSELSIERVIYGGDTIVDNTDA